ncbi:MAG TPA: hypothetical protein VFQ61_36080 [Polyangiaceae bacterium]|nr:hypothetical protein [Polyangiaceae bacterium]
MLRDTLALTAVTLLSAAGCTLDLEGARCEELTCAAGYVCCPTDNICYRPERACGSAGAANTGGTSGGTSPTAGRGASQSSGAPAMGGSKAQGGASGLATAGNSTGGATQKSGDVEGGQGGDTSTGDSEHAYTFAVLSQHNDNGRSGVNPLETVLTRANVASGAFGELSRRALRGAVFAEPLLVPNVPGPAGSVNLVVVATMANVVYAFDADRPSSQPFWVRSLEPPIELPDAQIPLGSDGIFHEVGILGTPVMSGDRLFVVTATRSGGTYRHWLHALDLRSGEVRSSVVIDDSGFDSAKHAQRAGLAYAEDTIYVAFGGYMANSDVGGWLFAYDTRLNPRGSVSLGNPNGAAIHMNGQAPAIDPDASVYVTTGIDANTQDGISPDFSTRLLRLDQPSTSGIVPLAPNPSELATTRLGRSGPLLVPGSNLAVVAEAGRVIASRRDAPGTDAPPAQIFTVNRNEGCALALGCDSAPLPPVFWTGASSAGPGRLYTWLPNDQLRGFYYDSSTHEFRCPKEGTVCPPFAVSDLKDSSDSFSHPPERGAALSFSTNRDADGSSLVWAAHGYTPTREKNYDGVVRAFDADTLSALWDTNSSETPLGPIAPGATPMVSGGRVYVGTADGLSGQQSFSGNSNGGAPALLNFGDRYLVLSWGLSPTLTRGFELAFSSDGIHFDDTAIVPASFLNYEPALAADGASRLYLGFCSNSQKAEVLVSSDALFSSYESLGQRDSEGEIAPLELKAASPLALAFGHGRLFMAWYDEAHLRFISSSDGIAFDLSTLREFPEFFAFHAPVLTYQDGNLFLVSTTTDGSVHLLVSNDDGATFAEPITLPMSSNGHPALLWDTLTGADAPPSYTWLWSAKSASTDGVLSASTGLAGDYTSFTGTRALGAIRTHPSISAARFKGAWHIAWLNLADSLPNVARYSSGELVTYGLKQP